MQRLPSLLNVHILIFICQNPFRQVVDLSPLPPDELARYGLSSSGGAQWWGAWLDVPYSAAVLNFVFSDREQRVWDNNGQRDFHTLVAGEGNGGGQGLALGVEWECKRGCRGIRRTAGCPRPGGGRVGLHTRSHNKPCLGA